MNQHQWVYGCYQYYLENHIEPGNPEDGIWEEAHWPVPDCKGGSKTILLLKQHHAVQGVLQSEEWQHPCIYGWEKRYLEGELLELYKKWKSEHGRRARTAEERRETARKVNASRTMEEHREYARKMNDSLTPEKRSERARKGNASRTPEQRSETARKNNASRTPEQRSENARKAWETRRANQAKRQAGG